MPMDKRTTSFQIHWGHDERPIPVSAAAEHLPCECGDRLLERITCQLEDAGADAVHVLAYWKQIRARCEEVATPVQGDVLQALIGEIQVLEDLYWGVELTLASRKRV